MAQIGWYCCTDSDYGLHNASEFIVVIYTFPDGVVTDDSEPDLRKLVYDTVAPYMAQELLTASHLDARWISNVNGGSVNAGEGTNSLCAHNLCTAARHATY